MKKIVSTKIKKNIGMKIKKNTELQRSKALIKI